MSDQNESRPLTRREMRMNQMAAATPDSVEEEQQPQANDESSDNELAKAIQSAIASANIDISLLDDEGRPRTRRELRELREAAEAEIAASVTEEHEEAEAVRLAAEAEAQAEAEKQAEAAAAAEAQKQAEAAAQAEAKKLAAVAAAQAEAEKKAKAAAKAEAEKQAKEASKAEAAKQAKAKAEADAAAEAQAKELAQAEADAQAAAEESANENAAQDEATEVEADAEALGADDAVAQGETLDEAGEDSAEEGSDRKADDVGYSFPDIAPLDEAGSIFDDPAIRMMSSGAASQAEDEASDDFDDLISRAVVQEGAASSSTTAALILPSMPNGDSLTGSIGETGELFITGSFDLPKSLSETGGHSSLHDSVEIEPLDELGFQEPTPTGSMMAPVAASSAVSMRSAQGPLVAEATKDKSKLPVVLIATGGVLVVGAVALIVWAAASGMFG